MSRTAVFSVVIATVMAKHQNVTVEIGEITCGGDKYPDSLTLQIWDKDILNDDLLGEMYFNDTVLPQNISFTATEDEILTMSPYLIFQHDCSGSCVRSRLNIPSDYVGGTYQNHQVELNSKFDDIKPC
ncbi:hypothetical protein Q1695_006108 [Nippostrongylus brasiliensis]|nr:hypothetical protein Q1695_006108 [Nippostrongylus brasiliensis]